MARKLYITKKESGVHGEEFKNIIYKPIRVPGKLTKRENSPKIELQIQKMNKTKRKKTIKKYNNFNGC